jgi:PAS domain S-box-containing protein
MFPGKRSLWLYPCCLFIFLTIVLTVKFVFIFFFSTAYEPAFIFELTPFSLLSGVSKVQLLLLSLLVLTPDLYLHLRSSRKRLLLSFIPTCVMLSNIGFTIMVRPVDVSSTLHYLLFVCLLCVVLIDYQCLLNHWELPTMQRKTKHVISALPPREPAAVHKRPLFVKHTRASRSHRAFPPSTPVFEGTDTTHALLRKMQYMVDELERKTKRMETWEHELEERRKTLLHQEQAIANRISSFLASKEKVAVRAERLIRAIPPDETMFLKEKIMDRLIVDETHDIVAVVQRGIFKQISNTFADFLGYERNELLQKSFFVFIAPHGFEDARHYYLNRLKGVTTNSFRTVLLTKGHAEVIVNITVTPTLYMGDVAEFLSIKEVKDAPKNA